MALKKIYGIEREDIKLTFTRGDVTCVKNGSKIPFSPGQGIYPVGYGPPASYYDAMKNNAMNGTGTWVITTGKDSYAVFFLCNDTVGFQTGKTFIRLEANSRATITITTVEKTFGSNERKTVVKLDQIMKNKAFVYYGTLHEDPDIASLETFEAVWNVLSKVNTEFLKKKVVDERRSTQDKEKLANNIIASCATAAGVASACSGIIGGAIAVVLEAANITAQWVLKTNMSYSLACIYMQSPPSQDQFKDHLLLLLGGSDAVKEAINNAAQSYKDSAVDTYKELTGWTSPKDDIKADILDSPAFKKVKTKVMEKLRKKLGDEFVGKLARSAKKVIPLGPAIYSAISDTVEATKLGKEAREFYKRYAAASIKPAPAPTPPKPTVTSVTVSPSSATVKRGTKQKFTASVIGTNNPAKTVKWVLAKGASVGTSIKDGLLSVGPNQNPGTITVMAMSTVDPTKNGTATVTVPAPAPAPPKPVPKVTSVTVRPSSIKVNRGYTMQFIASVYGNNNPAKTVKWSLMGASPGTSINDKGLLTVGANQSGNITVKVASTVDSSKSKTAVVTVPASSNPTPSKSTVTKVSLNTTVTTVNRGYTKQFRATVYGTNNPPKTVKWTLSGDNGGTKINDKGLLTVGANQSGNITVKATSTADPSKSRTATVKVTTPKKPNPPNPNPPKPKLPSTPKVTGVTLTPSSVTLNRGSTKQFTASVKGTNNPARTVTWSISGDNGGTSISSGGLLTVGANQSGNITVKAKSTADSSKSKSVTVKVSTSKKPNPPNPNPPKPTTNKIPYKCPTSTVKNGAKGEPVKWVQWSLNKIMNSGLSVDGSCGPNTVTAIKAFQKKYGLTADGSFGQLSRKKMIALLKAQGWS